MKENSNSNKRQAEEPEDRFWFTAEHRGVNYIENNLWIQIWEVCPSYPETCHPP